MSRTNPDKAPSTLKTFYQEGGNVVINKSVTSPDTLYIRFTSNEFTYPELCQSTEALGKTTLNALYFAAKENAVRRAPEQPPRWAFEPPPVTDRASHDRAAHGFGFATPSDAHAASTHRHDADVYGIVHGSSAPEPVRASGSLARYEAELRAVRLRDARASLGQESARIVAASMTPDGGLFYRQTAEALRAAQEAPIQRALRASPSDETAPF